MRNIKPEFQKSTEKKKKEIQGVKIQENTKILFFKPQKNRENKNKNEQEFKKKIIKNIKRNKKQN
jgi:hypothetical protein